MELLGCTCIKFQGCFGWNGDMPFAWEKLPSKEQSGAERRRPHPVEVTSPTGGRWYQTPMSPFVLSVHRYNFFGDGTYAVLRYIL